MVDPSISTLLDSAERASTALVSSVPGLRGICLFGSVARGTATEISDLDLLVVTDDPALTASRLREALPSELAAAPVSLAVHTLESLDEYLERWSRFGAHLRTEGKVLFDRDGELTRLLARDVPISLQHELNAQRRHLRNYAHPERFGKRFLFPLASLYRIGRAVTFGVLAERGILTFDAERAFTQLRELYPDRADDAIMVQRLKPFYDLVTRRNMVATLPFEPIDCADELVSARQAVARLLGLSSSQRGLAA